MNGWDNVTNVACPGCGVGLIRWAEAGAVPGWRECDTCGRQYMGDPATGLSPRRGAVIEVSPARIESVRRARQAAADTALVRDTALARDAARWDLGGSFLGGGWHAVGGYYPDGSADSSPGMPLRAAYWAEWRRGATPAAIATLDALPVDLLCPGEGVGAYGLRFRPRVAGISRDGSRVNLYRDGSGGTYEQPVSDALAGRVLGL